MKKVTCVQYASPSPSFYLYLQKEGGGEASPAAALLVSLGGPDQYQE